MGETGEVPQTQEVEKTTLDAILVFGQGPVIEEQTRVKAEIAQAKSGSEDINLWSHTLAKAAFELYSRGETREIIIMGGRTGGEGYQSEAGLIAKELHEKYNVSLDAIKLEDRSTNTLENIVNVLNAYIDAGGNYKNIGILGANQHVGRLRVLMEMFGLPNKHAFSAEEVVRFVARSSEEWDSDTLTEIENRIDMNAASRVPWSKKDQELGPGYYGTKKGEEQKTVHRRFQEEDAWRQVLGELPQYWIGYLGRLQNTQRIREILNRQGQDFLEQIKRRFDIDPASDTDTILKQKLLGVERKPPEGKNWGEYLEKRIGQLSR